MEENKHKYISDIAFTPAVKSIQKKYRSRMNYEKMERFGGWKNEVTPQLKLFLEQRDSFYLSTSNADGQPYVQHRGGPPGFLKVLDNNTLAFADFSGNKQYITIGNLSENNKAFIFLMDYPNQTRVKIWGTAYEEKSQDLIKEITNETYRARVERGIVFKIHAWDINCRQHIQQRYSKEEVELTMNSLQDRIKELELKISES